MPEADADAGGSTERRILDAARRRLAEDGLARMRVVDVAAAIGLSHAAIYRYFPSKDALADAVIAAWMRDLERDLVETAGSPDPADDKLERLLHLLAQGYRRRMLEEPRLFALLAAAQSEDRVIARRHRSRIRDVLDRVIEEGVSGGAFPPADRAAQVVFVFDMAHRFINPTAVLGDMATPEDAHRARRERCFAVALRGLRGGFGAERGGRDGGAGRRGGAADHLPTS
jgi:AcrR family transcriptional regulator